MWGGFDKNRKGRGADLHPKKSQKIQANNWEWYARPEKGEHIFPTIEFYRSVHKIPCFKGLFIDSLQFGAHCHGGGLERHQRKCGTGIHQKIFIGLLYVADICLLGDRWIESLLSV
jgi:hypothetical protein